VSAREGASIQLSTGAVGRTHRPEVAVVRDVFCMIREGSSVYSARAELEAERIPLLRSVRWQRTLKTFLL
jgi:hypothetical protein